MQQYAGVYLLQNYSTCFGSLSHPSSGVHQTATAASEEVCEYKIPPTCFGVCYTIFRETIEYLAQKLYDF